jgi:hypothetical protein
VSFKLLPQSGVCIYPNSFANLLLWIEPSENGTVSRSNTAANSVFDKSAGGREFISTSKKTRPYILQGYLNGLTVLRFSAHKSYLIGNVPFSIDEIFTIAVINGTIEIDSNFLQISNNELRIPREHYPHKIELAELLIYKRNSLSQNDINLLITYLEQKWIYPQSCSV